MSFWESSAFWGIAGIVVGAIVATLFFWLSKVRKRLEYQISSTRLITKNMANIPGIKITLDGRQVETVTSTTIKFMNTGNQTILPDDFAALEPLGISVTGQFFNIKQALYLDSDNPNSSPSVKMEDEKNMRIQFDFLKPKHYISITLLHNGTITILGELKNGEKIKEKSSTDKKSFFPQALCIFFGLLSMALVCLPQNETPLNQILNQIEIILEVLAIAILAFFIGLLIASIIYDRKR